MVEPTSNVG